MYVVIKIRGLGSRLYAYCLSCTFATRLSFHVLVNGHRQNLLGNLNDGGIIDQAYTPHATGSRLSTSTRDPCHLRSRMKNCTIAQFMGTKSGELPDFFDLGSRIWGIFRQPNNSRTRQAQKKHQQHQLPVLCFPLISLDLCRLALLVSFWQRT